MGKSPSALELLDACADRLRRVPSALGLLWLTALPSRLLLVRYALTLDQLGENAWKYRHAFQLISNAYLCTWLLSLYGRQLFVRALVRLDLREEIEGSGKLPERLRVPLAPLATHIYAAALLELAFWLLWPAHVLSPLLLLPAAIAAVTAAQPARNLVDPLAAIGRAMASFGSLFKISLLALIAFALAWANLRALLPFCAWLGASIPSIDAGALARTLDPEQPLCGWLVYAAASLLIEPFWLGMVALQVDAGRARQSGEDLLRRFRELHRSKAA